MMANLTKRLFSAAIAVILTSTMLHATLIY